MDSHIYFDEDDSVNSYTSEPYVLGSYVDDLGSETDDQIILGVVQQDRQAWKNCHQETKTVQIQEYSHQCEL